MYVPYTILFNEFLTDGHTQALSVHSAEKKGYKVSFYIRVKQIIVKAHKNV